MKKKQIIPENDVEIKKAKKEKRLFFLIDFCIFITRTSFTLLPLMIIFSSINMFDYLKDDGTRPYVKIFIPLILIVLLIMYYKWHKSMGSKIVFNEKVKMIRRKLLFVFYLLWITVILLFLIALFIEGFHKNVYVLTGIKVTAVCISIMFVILEIGNIKALKKQDEEDTATSTE